MKSVKILFLLILLLSLNANSQNYKVRNSELLSFLLNSTDSISDITNIDPYIPILPLKESKLINHRHELIKNKKGLFILIDQTGRVYKANNQNQLDIDFSRQDSTYYWGYNGSSYDFTFKDTLFSFGGGGFWRLNGQLRYYSNVFNEWNILPISEEYPTSDFINYVSCINSNLFYIQKPFDDAVTGKKIYDWRALRLNLNTKKNEILGTFSPQILELFKNNTLISNINLPSLDGTLVFFTYEKILLLNFNENSVYKLTKQSIKDLILGNSNSIQIKNTFQKKDTVFYTLSNDRANKLHYFIVSLNDFTKEPYPIYETKYFLNYSPYSLLNLFLVSIVLLSIWFITYKLRTRIQHKPTDNINIGTDNQNDFSPIESNLIDTIIACNEKGNFISGEQVNNILGVSKKSIETQKKVRGDTINRINYKFKTLFEIEVEFIERMRSENDRRFYNYVINKENAVLYKDRYKK